MLMGEYAVLGDGMAIISSINKYIHVATTINNTNKFIIESALGNAQLHLNDLKATNNFQYIAIALSVFPNINSAKIIIHNDFAHTLGLGSSAAVTIACINTLFQATYGRKPSAAELLELAVNAFKINKINGSGADLAASCYGGTIVYSRAKLFITRLPNPGVLHAIYSGAKTVTQSAIAIVTSKNNLEQLSTIYQEIAQLSQAAALHLQANNIIDFGRCMRQQQIMMQALGVSTDNLEQALNILNNNSQILGAKISGSGLGDCAIGISANNIALTAVAPLQILDVHFGAPLCI
jgi:mevalonate kinase